MARFQDLGKRRDIVLINPTKIVIKDGFNTRRFDTERAKSAQVELMNSIMENGVLTPLTIVIEGDVPVLTDGERRLRAVLAAIEKGWNPGDGVPCQHDGRAAILNEAERALSIITRNSGLALEPLEKAEVYRRLRAANWTVDQMARRTGVSPSQVNNLLTLVDAPTDVQDAIRDGTISSTEATNVVREVGKDAGEVIKAAKEEAQKSGKNRVTRADINKVTKKKTNTEVLAELVGLVESAIAGVETEAPPFGYNSWGAWSDKARTLI